MSETIRAKFYELVSGRRRGVGATLARGALRLAETPYSLAMRWRNRQYDNGTREIERVGAPVVSVGNLTLGGTGKTPMVEWLCRWFRARGVRVTIVSRGYKAGDGATNDEALELEQKLPDVPHVQNPDRVAAARMAIEEFEAQAIVLDDAFQHRRIARDLDIVLLDALAPFGFEHVFPRGMLREPLSGLARAHAVILTRADMATPAERGADCRSSEEACATIAMGRVYPPTLGATLKRRRRNVIGRISRPARGGVLWDWQSGRLPAHAGQLRIRGQPVPRVCRPSRLLSQRRRIAVCVGREFNGRCRTLHSQGPGQARPGPLRRQATVGGAGWARVPCWSE